MPEYSYNRFIEDGTHPIAITSINNSYNVGDIVMASHINGCIYDCIVVENIDGSLLLKRFKVNNIFYKTVIKEYKKYNKYDDLL